MSNVNKVRFSGLLYYLCQMRYIVALLIALLFSACSTNETVTESGIEPKSLTDFEEEIVRDISINYAENFKIISSENGYILDLIEPNTNTVERTYRLTYDDNLAGEFVIHLPLKNITALSQTTIGMLSDLKALKLLSGILDIDYVYDPVVIERLKSGHIIEFLDESNFPIEKAIQSETDLVIYSGFSREFPAEAKLNKFGISAIPCYDWRENHPLGRAEWVKFVGVLCGKTQESVDLFNSIEANYQAMCEKVADLSIKPSVISGNFWGDQWTAPSGDSYMSILFRDAGADYLFKETKGTGSIFTSMERIIKLTENTDYWINPGFSTKDEILESNPKGKYVGPLKLQGSRGVFCYSHAMNQYWERSAIEPHKLLEDLIHIFHPSIAPNSTLNFYRRLAD
ncbi:MAG: iron complex transport system substrate-binding protein [Flavobacteriaceae bacterium]